MDIERAKEITYGCVRTAFARTVGDERVPLPDCSLEEMLIANRLVQELGSEPNGDGTSRMRMTVDPRGIALDYAFEQFGSDPVNMLEQLGFSVTR